MTEPILSERARVALARAATMKTSYGVRFYAVPASGRERPRVLVVLGEAHLKLAAASAVGREVVDAFELRGVETFQTKRVVAGRLLGPLIHVPRLMLRAASLGAVKGSTITEAKALDHGMTVDLERTDKVPLPLHVASVYLALFFAVFWLNFLFMWLPFGANIHALLTQGIAILDVHLLALIPAVILRRWRWAWLLHPAVAIITVRDTLMAAGTVRMLAEHPSIRAAVVIMGRAHLPGYQRELLERHGFVRIDEA
ncbi:MAG: hypothetical protein NVS3B20_17620 [Polyangiales bacterium]